MKMGRPLEPLKDKIDAALVARQSAAALMHRAIADLEGHVGRVGAQSEQRARLNFELQVARKAMAALTQSYEGPINYPTASDST